jgi:hypothetical protein
MRGATPGAELRGAKRITPAASLAVAMVHASLRSSRFCCMTPHVRNLVLGLAALLVAGTAHTLAQQSSPVESPQVDAAAACSPQPGRPANAPALQAGAWVNISPRGIPFGPNPATFVNAMAVDPCNLSVLYTGVNGFDVETAKGGLYKSVDGGTTWSRVGPLDEPLHVRIDPANPQHLIVADGVRGTWLGLWISWDGGQTFDRPAGWIAARSGKFIDDVYDVALDPNDINHMLVTSHSAWGWTDTVWNTNSGVLETKDGGNTWITHPPMSSWGTGHGIWFINSTTWLLGTQGVGYWRTTDGGNTWQQVSTHNMSHGGGQLYKSPTGALYNTSWDGVLRSTDNGASWTVVGGGNSNGVIGDGDFLYAGPWFTNGGSYMKAPETAPTNWTPFNENHSSGPYEMVFDGVNGIVYSASWEEGVLALKVNRGAVPAPPTGLRILSGTN